MKGLCLKRINRRLKSNLRKRRKKFFRARAKQITNQNGKFANKSIVYFQFIV